MIEKAAALVIPTFSVASPDDKPWHLAFDAMRPPAVRFEKSHVLGFRFPAVKVVYSLKVVKYWPESRSLYGHSERGAPREYFTPEGFLYIYGKKDPKLKRLYLECEVTEDSLVLRG